MKILKMKIVILEIYSSKFNKRLSYEEYLKRMKPNFISNRFST